MFRDLSMFYKDNRRKDGQFAYCKDCHNLICAKYHRSNKFINYQNKYTLNKYHNNKQFRLQIQVRSGLRQAIKLNSTKGKVIDSLGCTIPELKTYLEKKFKTGMNWKNLSKTGWNIDHVKPLSLFDLTKQKEYNQACHYTNLQPLWFKENITKGSKF
jgi:hypothetical protein